MVSSRLPEYGMLVLIDIYINKGSRKVLLIAIFTYKYIRII